MISVENHKFSHPPMYLAPPLTGFALELGTDARGKKTRMTGLPVGERSFKMGLAV